MGEQVMKGQKTQAGTFISMLFNVRISPGIQAEQSLVIQAADKGVQVLILHWLRAPPCNTYR
jgi:hypothetical protein